MAKAGCHFISWGLESGNKEILAHAKKGVDPERAKQSLAWSRAAGIKNWGYFIIGLPGETVETIKQTIAFSKALPLDIALFHIAAPYPGTPFFKEVAKNGWFREGARWEEVDMDESTVLDYPNLRAEELEYWQKRAFREWAMRPGPDADLPEDAVLRHVDDQVGAERRLAAPPLGPLREHPARRRAARLNCPRRRGAGVAAFLRLNQRAGAPIGSAAAGRACPRSARPRPGQRLSAAVYSTAASRGRSSARSRSPSCSRIWED